MAESDPGFRARPSSRDPDLVSIWIRRPGPVKEVFAQKAEFPELIRDVLADVGDGTIRANNHLAVVFRLVPASLLRLVDVPERGGRHHPAVLVLALSLEIDGFAIFQQLKRGCPELEMQNLAFP